MKSPDKQVMRESIWKKMKMAGVERFPYAWGRIPNFEGAERAASRLGTLDIFKNARTVFVAPDSPQTPVRELVLRQGKTLIMPTPRLRSGFLQVNPVKGTEAKASTIRGALTQGMSLPEDNIPAVDLVVQGAVAVDLMGGRIGKGGGYGDREIQILRTNGKIPASPIVVTVHDMQVVDWVPQDAWDFTVDSIITPTRVLMTITREEVSKYISYILRHHPPPSISESGFVPLNEVTRMVRKKLGVGGQVVQSVADSDSKGRFEISHEKIRAVYGHSYPVSIDLNPADIHVLYHGTTEKAAARILREGLNPKGRQKVHLSPTIEVAHEVGKRHCEVPVLLKVDAKKALENGVSIQKASNIVYVADHIPPQYISRIEG
ncbi:MAG: RNA 2'-phosphotransferase [Theionarchaea archaeon]|nr:RNA 2'-phosphotransferase [Theionarchaea archaeon]MBU7038842.1 RNA 2'-phosphotransferase [Theionarchaea archaeon]